jgi:hypothetical protein
MKRIIVTLGLLLLLVGNVAGQTSPVDKGSLMFNGTAYFTSRGYEDEDDRTTVFNVSGGAGGFLAPGLMLGGNLIFQTQSYGDNSVTAWGIGPKFAYFFGANQQKPLPGAVYPVIAGTFTLTGASNGGSASGSLFSVEGGFFLMVTRSTALGVTAFYQFETMESFSSNTFGLMANFAFFVWE